MTPALPAPLHGVLFLCHGNIIRSPLAEAFLRQAYPHTGLRISSAGLKAQPGRPTDPRAQAAAITYGISLHDHRARPLIPELLTAADVVFLMDESNEGLLFDSHPSAKSKTRYLGEWSPQGNTRVIADPYSGSPEDVRQCAEEIRACTTALAATLQKTSAGR